METTVKEFLESLFDSLIVEGGYVKTQEHMNDTGNTFMTFDVEMIIDSINVFFDFEFVQEASRIVMSVFVKPPFSEALRKRPSMNYWTAYQFPVLIGEDIDKDFVNIVRFFQEKYLQDQTNIDEYRKILKESAREGNIMGIYRRIAQTLRDHGYVQSSHFGRNITFSHPKNDTRFTVSTVKDVKNVTLHVTTTIQDEEQLTEILNLLEVRNEV